MVVLKENDFFLGKSVDWKLSLLLILDVLSKVFIGSVEGYDCLVGKLVDWISSLVLVLDVLSKAINKESRGRSICIYIYIYIYMKNGVTLKRKIVITPPKS